MIPLTLGSHSEAERCFVTRLRYQRDSIDGDRDSLRMFEAPGEMGFAGPEGLFTIADRGETVDGDVVLIDPVRGAAERLIRASSKHNTLLITERCDQLCVMCSQPPKKTHVDRFSYYREASLLAPQGAVIGVSGGEPTLYKEELFDLIEQTLKHRPDLSFHVLSNGQHFDPNDVERLRQPLYSGVTWGIPLYSSEPRSHDGIVAKSGAYLRLEQSFHVLLLAGGNIELRTVVMQSTVPGLVDLARHIASRLSFVSSWSIMQLENTGFAKNRWRDLYYDHGRDFGPIAGALDIADLHGVGARLFNFPLCTLPANYRRLAPASISDWKKKFAPACSSCTARGECAGFFEWHPEDQSMEAVQPL
jgi:His-Xaa-Ser system radical SAM maturase HxsC